MDLDTYFKKYPEAEKYRGFMSGSTGTTNEIGCIENGVLIFTPETARKWGGPFPGGAALYHLLDTRIWIPQRYTLPALVDAQRYAIEIVVEWLDFKPKNKAKIQEVFEDVKNGVVDVIHQVTETGTAEHPFKIWMMGNDDTSYSKWFATEKEARELIELLDAISPIDFNKDFEPLKWTFTN